MYGFEIYIDNKLISDSPLIYDSKEEAESEADFAINTYADLMDRNWSEFTAKILE